MDIHIIYAGFDPDNNTSIGYPLYKQQCLATEDQ